MTDRDQPPGKTAGAPKLTEGAEVQRLKLLVKRDGIAAARAWALRTMKIYRAAVLDKGNENRPPHYATTREYRRPFIESYLAFKRFALTKNSGPET